MEIRELYMKSFGKFSEEHFLIGEGIHVFYGENEYGKSTIYAFIKAMLFGLERGRGKAALKDDFTRYEPWDRPNDYAGVMRFTLGGRNFVLERRFDRYAKRASLICEDDGEELSLEHGDLDMLLGGMTAAAFENVFAVGQLSAKPGQELAAELKNYAANYYETGGGEVNLQGALETLRMKRKVVEQELREIADCRDEKRQKLIQKCNYIQDDMDKLNKEQKENRLKSAGLEEEAIEIPGKTRKNTLLYGALSVLLAALVFLAAGGFLIGQGHQKTAGMLSGLLLAAGAGAGLIGMILLIISRRKNSSNSKQHAGQDNRHLAQELHWAGQRIRDEQNEKRISYENLQEQLAELDRPGEEDQRAREKLQALQLAETKIQEAAREITQGFGSVLNQKASEILYEVTDGKYCRLVIDEKLAMAVMEKGRKIPVERLSRGTVEQIYFALRMAAAEVLYQEDFPVILDDAFACYDEKRLKSTLKWLREQSRQVIIFTCQKREQEVLECVLAVKGRI